MVRLKAAVRFPPGWTTWPGWGPPTWRTSSPRASSPASLQSGSCSRRWRRGRARQTRSITINIPPTFPDQRTTFPRPLRLTPRMKLTRNLAEVDLGNMLQRFLCHHFTSLSGEARSLNYCIILGINLIMSNFKVRIEISSKQHEAGLV